MKVLEGTHNYATLVDFTTYLAYKIAFIFIEMQASINALAKANLPNAQILLTLYKKDSNVTLVFKDILNLIAKKCLK